MKLILLVFFPLITVGQKNCTGFIIDKNTNKVIPYATIGLVRENKGVNANELGAFSITVSHPALDSLRISCVGYETEIEPVSDWVNGKTVALHQRIGVLKEVVVSNRPKLVLALNKFRHCSSNWFKTGLEAIYQLAQRFEVPEPGMQLTELQLCKDPSESIFRVRIYDIDSTCQCPSKDIVDSLIEIKSTDNHVQVNLVDYNIFIPQKTFFVSIEWLFIPYNEQLEKVKRHGRKMNWIYYKPALRFVYDRNRKPASLWQRKFNGKWDEMIFSKDYNFQITTKLR
jgi:hypothetical protein